MATRPTRLQQQACDTRAQALLLITEAARLDGGRLEKDELRMFAERLAGASSAFTLDDLVVRAIDQRGRALGMPASTAELLTLLESDITPLETLLLGDDEFRDLARRVEEELGEV
jgi:succinate dehydrogenase/fumarate reductase flavoprotein subunit